MNNPLPAQIYDVAADHIFWIIVINLLQIAKFSIYAVL